MAASVPFGVLLDALGCRTDSSDPVRAKVARLALGAGYEPQRFSLLVEPVGRFAVQEAILDLVEDFATVAPLVLGLDDLHQADRATLATLGALGRRLAHLPVVVVMTCHRHPRAAELDLLLDRFRPAPMVMTLTPLNDAAVLELAERSTGTLQGRCPLDAQSGGREPGDTHRNPGHPHRHGERHSDRRGRQR